MSKHYVPFNKAGIRTTLYSAVSVIVAANPSTLNWTSPNEVTYGELPAKLTLLDRLDIILIFRDRIKYNDANSNTVTDLEKRARAHAYEMDETASKHFNFDYIFEKIHALYHNFSEVQNYTSRY